MQQWSQQLRTLLAMGSVECMQRLVWNRFTHKNSGEAPEFNFASAMQVPLLHKSPCTNSGLDHINKSTLTEQQQPKQLFLHKKSPELRDVEM